MLQYLSIFIRSIRVPDVVDIAAVSFIIYKILGFMKFTRAAQLLKGIGIIVVAYFLSSAFHLYTVNWILSKVLDIGIIALIIVFQPELRRALEYLGRHSFSVKQFTSGDSPATAPADAITKAVDYFASIKEGALIVVERETALSDYVAGATIVDAQISEELLKNIFYLGSPLHDGAVIIRNGRIYAAGVVLPLTANPNLSKDLGTRHRAGIGITEVSDALVFIVSEETGIISMAEDGRLTRFLDPKAVEKTLLAYYMSQDSHGDHNTIMDYIGRFINGTR